jgi:probable rRNA maturation factor
MMAAALNAVPDAPQAPDIDVVVESTLWDAEPASEATLRRAILAAAAAMSAHDMFPGDAELAVVLSDDASIRTLNKQWRHIDKPTNVLSFPSGAPRHDGQPVLLGDIVIAYETTAAEAAAEGKPFLHHLSHLAVHGFLHLVGHDHETDPEADAMEALEQDILARLDIPDPYCSRDSAA